MRMSQHGRSPQICLDWPLLWLDRDKVKNYFLEARQSGSDCPPDFKICGLVGTTLVRIRTSCVCLGYNTCKYWHKLLPRIHCTHIKDAYIDLVIVYHYDSAHQAVHSVTSIWTLLCHSYARRLFWELLEMGLLNEDVSLLQYVLNTIGKGYRTPLMTGRHWFRLWIGAGSQQAITWANVDPELCHYMASLVFNKLQNRCHFAGIFKCIFYEKVWICNEMSLGFAPKGPIDNNSALAYVIAWTNIDQDRMMTWGITRLQVCEG